MADDENYNSKILNSNFETKIEGILSEINIEDGYMKIKQGEEYTYYNFKFEQKDVKNIFSSNKIFLSKKDGKYGIMMSEVLTQREETYTDSDENKQTRTTTLFHGLFAKIDMEKSINSNLDIKPNNILSGLSPFNKNKLEMDSRRI